jgi:hypothetical protein
MHRVRNLPCVRAALIVCERTHRWAIAFRAALASLDGAGKPPEIVEVRSLTQAQEARQSLARAAIAVEITAASLTSAVDWIAQVGREKHAVCIALLEPELAAAESLVREAGAVATLTTALDVPAASRMILKHLDQAPPAPATDLRAHIAARMPWSAASHTTPTSRVESSF